MASIDEVSGSDTNGLFTSFFDSERTDWNGRGVADLTTEDKNSNSSHQLSLEKLVLLREEIFYENNRKKNAEQTTLDRNFSFPNQGASAFFSGDNGEEIIDAKGKFEGEGGFKIEWGGNESPKYGGYFEGRYEDEKGRYIDGRVEGDSDGNGRFEIGGGKGSQYD